MALVGGGAGNVAGSNPSGTSSNLQYIGDFAYAYSGLVATSATPTNCLDFTTGNSLFVGSFQPFYLGDSSNNIRWDVKFNGEIISGSEVSSSRDNTPFEETKLIIPPFTRVEISMDNLNEGTDPAGAVITGRVYRSE